MCSRPQHSAACKYTCPQLCVRFSPCRLHPNTRLSRAPFLATCAALLPASNASTACGSTIRTAITCALIPSPLTQSTLAATGFLSLDEVGEAVTALPTVSSAETRTAVAALGEAEGAADSSSNPLAANVRLLAVCMRGLPDMLTGACSNQS